MSADRICTVQRHGEVLDVAFANPPLNFIDLQFGREGLALERQLFLGLLRTEQAREGIRAFPEGRAPRLAVSSGPGSRPADLGYELDWLVTDGARLLAEWEKDTGWTYRFDPAARERQAAAGG